MRVFRTFNDTRHLRRIARDRFGWSTLRPHQLMAMQSVMSGRDTLVVAPTGGGKSGVYQVPATLLPGPTIVVSPLLALQHDQMVGLNGRDHATLAAVRLSSAESHTERRAAIEALRSGEVEFVFLTPEQLADPDRLAEIRALKPSLIAVDEAHCISAWGHDFRPDYLQLGRIIDELGRPPVVALTATASPPVRDDIIARLGLRDPRVIIAKLDRPNLFLEAVHCPDEDYRWRRLLARVRDSPPPGIVYAPTRRGTEELTARLIASGVPAAAYHGGLSAAERERCHQAFLADEIPVMVATTAFGMGIDKANLRWVNHVSLPDSPDSYFQEIGRAGRDGEAAQALLLHRTEDSGLRRFFSSVTIDADQVRQLAVLLQEADRPLSRTALRERTDLGPRRLAQLLTLLEEVGAAVAVSGSRFKAPRYGPEPHEAAQLALAQAERRQTVQRSRLDMMRHFADTEHCRGQAILAYFGDHLAASCGHCDNCLTDNGRADHPLVTTTRAGDIAGAGDIDGAGPFPVHSTVRHATWGAGMVLQYVGEQMTVLFDDVGYKTLSVPVVEKHGLLIADAR